MTTMVLQPDKDQVRDFVGFDSFELLVHARIDDDRGQRRWLSYADRIISVEDGRVARHSLDGLVQRQGLRQEK